MDEFKMEYMDPNGEWQTLNEPAMTLEIRILGLLWVRSNKFTRLFWFRDKRTGLYISRATMNSTTYLSKKK